MKHMKRVTSFLLAMLLTLSLCVPALALTPTADKEIVKAGEEVQVTLTTDQTMQNIVTLQAAIYWDGSVFDYKSFTAEKEEQMTVYNGDRTDESGRTYRTVDYVSNGKGKFAANAEFAVFTFTAKKDIDVSKTTDFVASIIYSKTLDTENNNAQVNNEFVTAEKTLSVTVTPASTEPEVKGYTVAASANESITVGDTAQVTLTVGNTDSTVSAYNAYDMTVTYNTDVLEYDSVADVNGEKPNVVADDGTLRITGYGKDKTCGTDNIVLNFIGKTTGSADVTVTSAKVDAKANAIANDAPDANITAGTVTIVVGGYKVSLPAGFDGPGTAEPNKDYTFKATDPSKDYDFSGSTMNGEDVEIVDNGGGSYTVKNVTGELIIRAAEKVSKVKINLTNNTDATITGITDGQEVDPGTALTFMITPTAGKVPVVTVNGTVLEGTSIMGGQRYQYTIAGDVVTGTELNIVVNYKADDQATIIESGAAWANVSNLSRSGWSASGDKVDAGANLIFFFKPENGKTIDDYVIQANGVDCTYTKVAARYKVTIPAEVITAGATVTIYFDYAKEPEPTITVNAAEYVKLNDQRIVLITATCEGLTDGKALAYDGTTMYWSEKYNDGKGAYAWLLIDDGTKTLDELKTAAEAAVKVADGTAVKIAYDGDVNLTKTETSAGVDINDAQLVWNMYNAEYSDFEKVSMRKFLEADMNGDMTLNTNDAAAIVTLFTTKQ